MQTGYHHSYLAGPSPQPSHHSFGAGRGRRHARCGSSAGSWRGEPRVDSAESRYGSTAPCPLLPPHELRPLKSSRVFICGKFIPRSGHKQAKPTQNGIIALQRIYEPGGRKVKEKHRRHFRGVPPPGLVQRHGSFDTSWLGPSGLTVAPVPQTRDFAPSETVG